jgi:hypothetical protein
MNPLWSRNTEVRRALSQGYLLKGTQLDMLTSEVMEGLRKLNTHLN